MSEQPTLGDIGSKSTVDVAPGTPLRRAVELMNANRISCLVVTEERRPVGILTERDLLRLIAHSVDAGETPIRDLMSSPPLVASADMPYLDGYQRCAERGVRHLILVDDKGLLAGVVTETDFMNHLGLDAYVEIKPVSSVMTRRPLTLREDQSVREALDLMFFSGVSCVVVERESCPVGILSERDMVRLSEELDKTMTLSVSEVMSSPVFTVTAAEPLHEAGRIMRERRIRRLAVVDDKGALIGIVTGHDLVKGLESRYTAFLRQVIEHQGQELTRTRKRLNESLVLENILRASFGMAILAMDLECRVRYFNPAAESVFGVAAEGAVGRDLEDLYQLAGLDLKEVELGTREARDGRSYEYDYESPGTEGIRYFQCRVAPIKDPRDQIQGFVHTLSDVTAARNAQEEHERLTAELLQARKMEAIGQLTGGIAHDFNNILASVLGYTRLALDSHDSDEDRPRIPGYLAEVYKGGKRAQELVRQLLAFSRSSPQNPQHLDLVPLIQEVTKMLRSMLPSTLSLKLALDRGAPAVFLDPVQVQQLLMNLVLNARDSIADHGQITIGLRLVRDLDEVSRISHRSLTGEGDWVELSVTDTGSGMAPEVLERAFDPFFTTKEVGRGSGMGLSVVHGIVTRNGGEILVESEPGRGSIFRLLFPPSSESGTRLEDMPVGSVRPRKPESGRHRILVADDETSVAGFLGELLERTGYLPTVVTNGAEALEVFQRSPVAFDLVIADQVMPKLTGIELASRVHDIRPSLPVILATALGENLINPGGLYGKGPMTILSKPVEPEDLLAAIDSLIEADSKAG